MGLFSLFRCRNGRLGFWGGKHCEENFRGRVRARAAVAPGPSQVGAGDPIINAATQKINIGISNFFEPKFADWSNQQALLTGPGDSWPARSHPSTSSCWSPGLPARLGPVRPWRWRGLWARPLSRSSAPAYGNRFVRLGEPVVVVALNEARRAGSSKGRFPHIPRNSLHPAAADAMMVHPTFRQAQRTGGSGGSVLRWWRASIPSSKILHLFHGHDELL